jgi:outer membrane protein assembly factor BamB
MWHHVGATAIPVSSAASAVLHGQSLYLLHASATDSRVVALDAASGRTRWQSEVRSIGYLSADDLRVYCLAACADGSTELVALDAGSGAVLWRLRPDRKERLQYPCGAVPMPDGRVCWSTNAAVHMIDAAQGSVLWSRPLESEGLLSGAVLLDGELLVASCNHLYSLSPDAGEVVRHRSLSAQGPLVGRPLLEADDGRAYLAERFLSGSQVTCIGLTDCEVLWTEKVSQPVVHLLAAAGRLYVRTQSVQAFDAAAGRSCWKRQAQGCGPVTLADGLVYFVDTTGSGRLVAVDAATGSEAWQAAGIRSCEAVLAARSTAYLKTHDGVLRAVVLANQS